MNAEPLFVSSLLVLLLAACGLEGGALSVGQAAAAIIPGGVLAVWSFRQTNWYEPAEGGKDNDLL